ncbi:hypothetical protein HanPSC8_Chr05g0197581 [Helianthus annuus]|nr:hypothetical protein HanPSC8_Chr05g0197581 [Helianthus annuus]
MIGAPLCTFFLPSHLHLPSERLSSARASVAPARYSGNNKSGSWLHTGQGHAVNFPILVRFMAASWERQFQHRNRDPGRSGIANVPRMGSCELDRRSWVT